MVQPADQQDVKSLNAPEPQPAAPAPQPRRGTAGLWGACLLLAAAASTGGYWGYLQLSAQAAQLAQLTATAERQQASLQQLDNQAGKLQASAHQVAREMSEQIQLLEQQLQARLDEQARQLAGMTASSRVAFELNEALFLLRQASQRLQLERAPDSPIQLMRLTDGLLASLATELGNPAGLLAARAQLARDLNSLQALQAPDLSGRYLALEALAGQLDALPLGQPPANFQAPQDPPTVQPEAGLWARLQTAWYGFLDQLAGFVRLRKTDEQTEPLLAPEQADNLRANIHLRVQTAQWALLRGDATIYQQALHTAGDWLVRYYPDSPARAAAASELGQLTAAPVSVALPDISASHRALEAFRDQWLREVQP